MKRNIITAILLILVLVFGWLAFSPNSPKETSVKKSHFASALSASGNITCTYPQVLHASYQSGEITIDATQTISEVPVIKVVDTADKLMFLEGNGDPYMTMHTIYKDSGVATYEKSMSLLGIPVGTISMGTCVDY